MIKVCMIIFFIPILVFSWNSTDLIDEDAEKPWEWKYQDIIVNGEVVVQGYGPDCPARYEAIRSILKQYQRPFTVLDIAANNGYFDFRILEEFDATCVMIDKVKGLSAICEANTHVNNKIIELKKHISLEELARLAECEHFDVVLVFNFLHHQRRWREWIEILQKLGDNLIIESPPSNDPLSTNSANSEAVTFFLEQINNYILSLPNSKVIAYTPRRPELPNVLSPMVWIRTPKDRLLKKSWDASLASEENKEYLVVSSWDQKIISIHAENGKITRPWLQGINLFTFIRLNGSFPVFESTELSDNIIVQGKTLVSLK